MIDERRKSQRVDSDEVAYISSSGSSTHCTIVNISEDGAALDVPNALYIPNFFLLMTERDRLVRSCRIVWIKHNRIGVEFGRAEEQTLITHRERQFLQYLGDAAWRRANSLPESAKLILKMLRCGWMERSGEGNDIQYRSHSPGWQRKLHRSEQ